MTPLPEPNWRMALASRFCLAFVLVAVGCCAFNFWAGRAHGQSDDTALTLARSCVAEIGLEGRTDECNVMWHVLLAKAGTPHAAGDLSRRYNALFRHGAAHPRAWVLRLREDGQQPDGWPRRLSWKRWRWSWFEKLHAAHAFVADPGAHPCPRAEQYGGRCDDSRHACDKPKPHWHREWCGKPRGHFAQAYWSVTRAPQGESGAVLSAAVAAGREGER